MIWLTQIFYFKTFVTEFFRLKKKYWKIHQKNWGGNPVYMPKKDPCSTNSSPLIVVSSNLGSPLKKHNSYYHKSMQSYNHTNICHFGNLFWFQHVRFLSIWTWEEKFYGALRILSWHSNFHNDTIGQYLLFFKVFFTDFTMWA